MAPAELKHLFPLQLQQIFEQEQVVKAKLATPMKPIKHRWTGCVISKTSRLPWPVLEKWLPLLEGKWNHVLFPPDMNP